MLDIPLTQRPEFIPAPANGADPTFEQAAALFAYGDIDGMLTDYLAAQHMEAALASGQPEAACAVPRSAHATPTSEDQRISTSPRNRGRTVDGR